MAARKRSSRSAKRSTGRSAGRSTRSKGNAGSSAPILALGAILGLGAFSLWATTQHKSPQAALTALFQRPSPQTTISAPPKLHTRPSTEKAAIDKKTSAKDYAGAVGPIPRPAAPIVPAPIVPALAKPQKQAAIQSSKAPIPTQKVAPPLASPRPLPMPPRGTNSPGYSPSVVYAKTKLTIHKNAWNRSPAIGAVEKGREMRSYGKTGKWHKVAVPTTNIIGWVHEDQLLGGRNKPDSAQMITTGSIARKPQTQAAPVAQKVRIEPSIAVGHKN
ncbi:hypothetical protein ACFQ3K_04220 [Brucella gallinifaecis]|uniref:Proline-rich extensin n=1 Tax=Brucella gallinifaecis TaxID=215590 RepID=A0A502BQ54_9HYPH|nr:hypothetical protein [Brucella gallinifaecis]TPF75967.1 hypothetical protein FHY56_04660 [Brucella gallinifaecis]